MDEATGEERDAGRMADGEAVGVLEARALASEAIDARRRVGDAAVRTDDLLPDIVRKDEDDVRRCGDGPADRAPGERDQPEENDRDEQRNRAESADDAAPKTSAHA